MPKLCPSCRSSGWLREGVRCHCNPAPKTDVPAAVIEKAHTQALQDFRRCDKGVKACRIEEDRHGWETERSYYQGKRHAFGQLLGINK